MENCFFNGKSLGLHYVCVVGVVFGWCGGGGVCVCGGGGVCGIMVPDEILIHCISILMNILKKIILKKSQACSRS